MIIFGKGAHAGSVISSIYRYSKLNNFDMGDIVSVQDGEPIEIYFGQSCFISIGDNATRERISKMDFNFKFSIWDVSSIGGQSILNDGNFFGANSYVGPNCKVGNFCIINTGVILEHDSIVGDFCHLAPGVITGGRVSIGSRTTIGLGSIIRDGVHIGENVVIGMGSIVTKDVPSNQVWFGNPARPQRRNK